MHRKTLFRTALSSALENKAAIVDSLSPATQGNRQADIHYLAYLQWPTFSDDVSRVNWSQQVMGDTAWLTPLCCGVSCAVLFVVVVVFVQGALKLIYTSCTFSVWGFTRTVDSSKTLSKPLPFQICITYENPESRTPRKSCNIHLQGQEEKGNGTWLIWRQFIF